MSFHGTSSSSFRARRITRARHARTRLLWRSSRIRESNPSKYNIKNRRTQEVLKYKLQGFANIRDINQGYPVYLREIQSDLRFSSVKFQQSAPRARGGSQICRPERRSRLNVSQTIDTEEENAKLQKWRNSCKNFASHRARFPYTHDTKREIIEISSC